MLNELESLATLYEVMQVNKEDNNLQDYLVLCTKAKALGSTVVADYLVSENMDNIDSEFKQLETLHCKVKNISESILIEKLGKAIDNSDSSKPYRIIVNTAFEMESLLLVGKRRELIANKMNTLKHNLYHLHAFLILNPTMNLDDFDKYLNKLSMKIIEKCETLDDEDVVIQKIFKYEKNALLKKHGLRPELASSVSTNPLD